MKDSTELPSSTVTAASTALGSHVVAHLSDVDGRELSITASMADRLLPSKTAQNGICVIGVAGILDNLAAASAMSSAMDRTALRRSGTFWITAHTAGVRLPCPAHGVGVLHSST